MEHDNLATNNEQSLWLLERCVPGTGVNNVPFAFRVAGGLRRDVLATALGHVLDRHPVLRRRFLVEDARLVISAGQPDTVDLEDITGEVTEFATRPFTVDGGSLLRVGVAGELVCVVAHHLVFDALSAFLFGADLAAAYDAVLAGTPLPAPAPAPARTAASGGEFWRRHLDGFDPAGLALGIATREATTWTLAGAQVTHELTPEIANVITRLRKSLRAPDGVLLLAAYYLLLARHGAGPDLVVGAPFTTRDESTAKAVGFHVNVAPLRVSVDERASFRDLTRRVREVFLAGLEHRAEQVEVPADRPAVWRNPVFRHVFNYVPVGAATTFEFGGAPAEVVQLDAAYSKFDLEFFLLASPERLALRAVYATEVHDEADVVALLERYEHLLLAVDTDPDLPIGDLPSWGTVAPAAPAVAVAGSGPVDEALVERLVGLWHEVLGRTDLGPDANFFDSGGHSLLAAKLAQLAEGATGVPLTLAEFFAHPTPRALAAHLRGA
ncbi:hypothetical protein BLA60_30515 [Actinophytocola xinjiangensis]|uniref:Carrier domain-containing protein n=1 Tax=Actinophytocola xinjiangensis TaxID=485602 RepID=A0A7Z0WGC6_9PSEU|nr:condensation domain-containing protein [Actinophytocola xinjiangensis]OLF06610.1 hypothetical protein BLA60_30515 [Actinophytocola xinjiangensis]